MSATTDSGPSRGFAAAAWRPAGLLYLAFLLAGLALGLWPEIVHVARQGLAAAPRPALQTVALSQAAFFLLAQPLASLTRRAPNGAPLRLPHLVVETAVLLLVGIPFVAAAAYVSDADVRDAVRAMLAVGGLIPLSWGTWAWMASSGRLRPWIVLVLLIVSLGLPCAWYIATEFMTPGPIRWLWELSPAAFVWGSAGSRVEAWLPRPFWAWLVWPIAGTLAMLLRAVAGRNPQR